MNVLSVSLLSIIFLHSAQCSLLRQNIFYSVADLIGTSLNAIKVKTDPDWGLDIHQTTQKYGYNLDTHETTTEDGYILKIHHLSHAVKNSSSTKRPVAFLMHPLTSSSRIWVCLGRRSLGYALVDAGYDVWMGNGRGSRYGRAHVKLDPDNDPEFWNFSFDEVGYFDLPAMVDYVLNETKEENLIIIGHSQGNTEFFTMAARRPEYNKKMKALVAAGPAVFITGTRFKFVLAGLETFTSLFGMQEVFRPGPLIPQLARLLCSGGKANLCTIIYETLFGRSTAIHPESMALAFSSFPEGISRKVLVHYHQLINTGEFKRFDYGEDKNTEVYGQRSAPEIDVSKITAPVALFYTLHDLFAPAQKLFQLEHTLPNVQYMYKIDSEYFNHADFAVGDARDTLFHPPLIRYLNSITKTPENSP